MSQAHEWFQHIDLGFILEMKQPLREVDPLWAHLPSKRSHPFCLATGLVVPPLLAPVGPAADRICAAKRRRVDLSGRARPPQGPLPRHGPQADAPDRRPLRHPLRRSTTCCAGTGHEHSYEQRTCRLALHRRCLELRGRNNAAKRC